MIELSPERIAELAGAELADAGSGGRPVRAVVDSREVRRGDLFVGIAGSTHDGGRFAPEALAAGAWGVLVDPEHAAGLAGGGRGWVLAAEEPAEALAALARGWRRELGCPVVGITGSTGKTSVKDVCRSLLPRRVHASPENYNTEIGLPLAILGAPAETEVLVLEMAMRGMGQIAELCEIAEPDVAAITNIGPVHLELLGTIEAIAEAKAEILSGLAHRGPHARAVIPEDAEALEPHLDDELVAITFGAGGDVFATEVEVSDAGTAARIQGPNGEGRFRFPFTEAHNLANALCAVAIGVALGIEPAAMAPRAGEVVFSRLRGERVSLRGGIVVLNDCYNANPISMRAAIEHLASVGTPGRRLAVLGGMAELGPEAVTYHQEVGALARGLGIGPLIGIGELARDYSPDIWAADPEAGADRLARMLEPGDVVLVKGSRAVGLERLTDALRARLGEASDSR